MFYKNTILFKQADILDSKINPNVPKNSKDNEGVLHDEVHNQVYEAKDNESNNSSFNKSNVAPESDIAQLKPEIANNLQPNDLHEVLLESENKENQPIAELKKEEIINTENQLDNLTQNKLNEKLAENETEADIIEQTAAKSTIEKIVDAMEKGVMEAAINEILPAKEESTEEKERSTQRLVNEFGLSPSIKNFETGYDTSNQLEATHNRDIPQANEIESLPISIQQKEQVISQEEEKPIESKLIKSSKISINLPILEIEETIGIELPKKPEDQDLEEIERLKYNNAMAIYAKIYNEKVKERRNKEQEERLEEIFSSLKEQPDLSMKDIVKKTNEIAENLQKLINGIKNPQEKEEICNFCKKNGLPDILEMSKKELVTLKENILEINKEIKSEQLIDQTNVIELLKGAKPEALTKNEERNLGSGTFVAAETIRVNNQGSEKGASHSR